jgi:hypothetical protein
MKMLMFCKGSVTVTSSLTNRPYLQYRYADGPPGGRPNALCVCLNVCFCALNSNAGLDTLFKHSEEYLNGFLLGRDGPCVNRAVMVVRK